MIVAERKPIEEIVKMLTGHKVIMIAGCGEYTTVCFAGGEKEVGIMASQLRLLWKKQGKEIEIIEQTIKRQCEKEFADELKENIQRVDAVLSLGCGAGVQFISEIFPSSAVYPALNTKFIGVTQEAGIWSERCLACGECILDRTGGICSTYLHNLKVRDSVTFTGPYGEFHLNEDPSVEIVCVGGGCGMAPIKNIIYTLYDRWPDRSCWLFFGCRTTHDIFYLEQFEELSREHPNFHVVYALSDELGQDEQWDGETGFIHLAVDKYLEVDIKRQAFLCGPPPMIEAVTRILEEKGLRSGDIFYDEF